MSTKKKTPSSSKDKSESKAPQSQGGDGEDTQSSSSDVLYSISQTSGSSGSESGTHQGSSGTGGLNPALLNQLALMVETILDRKLSALNILSQGVPQITSHPTSGSAISAIGSSIQPATVASSAVDMKGTQNQSSTTSLASSGPSYSAVVASHSTPSISSTAFVNSTIGLYGNQDKVSATLPALKPLPKNADYDTFEEWRRAAINDMVNTGGMDHVVTKSSNDSLALAISADTAHRSNLVIEQLWKTLHLKACSVLKTAFRPALGNTPEMEAELEQQRNPHLFIVNNANWLWQFASKQFVPDQVGRITKALRSLESLRFVPAKMTPSEYNTAFRAAINEIRSADPNQNFTEQVKLAYYLKGWPVDLNQKLDLVKADPTPTVDLAQRHLQQWYNDHGKKGKAKTDPPSEPNPANPPPNPPKDSLAALKEAHAAAKKKFDDAAKRLKYAEKKAGKGKKSDDSDQKPESDKDENKKSKHSLGTFTERKLTTPNPFGALADEEDSTSSGVQAPFGAVSADGREFVNMRNEFLLDSGASRSVVYDSKLLRDPQPLKQPIIMSCAMGKSTVLNEYGSVQLSKSVSLNNVCYAKGARLNAMSVSRITDTGYYCVFGSHKAVVVKKEALDYAIRRVKPHHIALTVPRVGDIYQYTRPGTGPNPDAPPQPAITVDRSKSIPLSGEKPRSSNSTTQSARPRTQTADSRSSSSSSSSSSTSSTQASQASLNAITAAAMLKEYGLPPDTEVEWGQWYTLSERRKQSL